MTTTTRKPGGHYIGDGCPGGHRNPAELVDHLNRELAAVDIAALARRLTKPQRKVLAEVPAGNLRQDELTYRYRAYVYDGLSRVTVTTTAKALLRHDLVQKGQREPHTWHSIYTLTDLGRAVLDHLTAEAKS